MREREGGAIVNIASINGLRGKFGQANYAASKGGVIAFTRAVAKEVGRFGIRVNAIAPGLIETPMTASLPEHVRAQAKAEVLLGRLGSPQDIASAVLFLASPLAAHVTGHILVVDGGQTV
jgi:NAD(P)-dependent dehydrogenase (short-subunit alcohol dehydrogenase family)